MRDVFRGSTVVRIVRHSWILQQCVAAIRALTGRLPDSESESDESTETASQADSSTSDSAGLVAGSLLIGVLGRFGSWIEGSWLYRWLTAEPDPDVIVIDLRETRLVGPVLGVLDWVLGGLARAGGGSTLGSLAARGYRLATGRPIQLASAALVGVVLALVAVLVATGTTSVPLLGVVVVLAVCAAVGSRISWSWQRVRQTRAVSALVAAFEPPEPPERANESTDGRSDDDS
ncbi:hypothetical protein GRX03_02125 [Halovenus sp. WSH3]|uniref:Uncharacterized protein n=1 Tax=Halovenus carboxidivorans TaxID=2692199 RepID=A0A6B0SYG2_9EURY|nr:hypothetical protein [Halovenus carboxidivorans]MXR50405.1 hypothetical protein [Halovenus carboxidivorans]